MIFRPNPNDQLSSQGSALFNDSVSFSVIAESTISLLEDGRFLSARRKRSELNQSSTYIFGH